MNIINDLQSGLIVVCLLQVDLEYTPLLPLEIRVAAYWTLLCPDLSARVVLVSKMQGMLLLMIVGPGTVLSTAIVRLSGHMFLSQRLMEAHYPITTLSSIELNDSCVYILLKGIHI